MSVCITPEFPLFFSISFIADAKFHLEKKSQLNSFEEPLLIVVGLKALGELRVLDLKKY